MSRLKVINLSGGPSVGKSMHRGGLFSRMKEQGFSVEESTEVAKDLTYEEHYSALSDQLSILAAQHRKLERLRGKVEWVVCDAPLLVSLYYSEEYKYDAYLPNSFKSLVLELWNSYDNYNFMIQRNPSIPYETHGRRQTPEEAENIDRKLSEIYINNNVDYLSIMSSTDTVDNILRVIRAGNSHELS